MITERSETCLPNYFARQAVKIRTCDICYEGCCLVFAFCLCTDGLRLSVCLFVCLCMSMCKARQGCFSVFPRHFRSHIIKPLKPRCAVGAQLVHSLHLPKITLWLDLHCLQFAGDRAVDSTWFASWRLDLYETTGELHCMCNMG